LEKVDMFGRGALLLGAVHVTRQDKRDGERYRYQDLTRIVVQDQKVGSKFL
jgi:hypothetical protein